MEMRKGKTVRDHTTGAWDNRFKNREARVAWQHDSHSTNKDFPKESCNGKKNRIR